MTSVRGAVAILIAATVSAAYAQAPEERHIEVRNPDGTVYGSLRLNAGGDVLLLSWRGREQPFGQCIDDVQEEVKGDGATAVIYERNCGATVDFATHVALRSGAGSEVVAVFEGRVRDDPRGREMVGNGIQYFECRYCPEKALPGPN